MMQGLKAAIQGPVIEKQIKKYYDLLDEKFLSYDKYICAKETAYENKIQKSTKSLRIIPMSKCTRKFASSDYAEEILVFVKEMTGISKKATEVILDAFEKHPEAVIVYGDEDEWNSDKQIRMNPWFKPDFSPDMLLECFYIGNVIAVKKAYLDMKVWPGYDNPLSNLYELSLETAKDGLIQKKQMIHHCKYVLYHSSNLFPLCREKEYDDIRTKMSGIYSRQFAERADAKVSIVIPSKDHPEILEKCLKSIISKTKNVDYDILVVDNGSSPENRKITENMKVKYGFNYVYSPMEFNFSAMCNLGAKHAKGNYVLFLNDDIEVRQAFWLQKMVQKASYSYVGAVGAKLYYPDSQMIQHAGVYNLRLGPVHKLQFKEDNCNYYHGINNMVHNVLAVTGACLLIKKDVFHQIGGFNEELAIAFNDVDLCFSLHEAGYYNVICNNVHLWHHESLSRGDDNDAAKLNRLLSEREKLYCNHPDLYGNDPYYHPELNHDILDTNFSYTFEYMWENNREEKEAEVFKNKLRPEWENECVLISMEYAGFLENWIDFASTEKNTFYLQGYSFVAGSDNACYKKSILLLNEETGLCYEVPCNEVYRTDLQTNLEEELHASMCGFAVSFGKNKLEKGTYRIGIFADSKVSRQKLYRFCQKTITV